MRGHARFAFICCLFVLAALGIAGCAGTPSDFDTVVLRPSAREIAAGGAVTITASVPKDTMNEGVTWVLTPGPGAPVPPGTFLSTNEEATFTAPVTVLSSYYVTFTATSIAFPTESNSVKITIQPPPPLKIITTSLPNGTLGVLYPTTVLQAKGGVPPYTWSLTGTSGPLPAGLTLASDGTISGTPTGSTTGVFPITVQVADSEVPPMMPTAPLSITITNILSGNYAFEFNGFNTNGAVVAAGTFVSDGVSAISGGVEDFNTIAGTPSGGTLETFTGTYTIGTDGRGTLTFNTSKSGTLIYAFALDSGGLHGRLVELDASGNRGSGEIEQQSAAATTCASIPFRVRVQSALISSWASPARRLASTEQLPDRLPLPAASPPKCRPTRRPQERSTTARWTPTRPAAPSRLSPTQPSRARSRPLRKHRAAR